MKVTITWLKYLQSKWLSSWSEENWVFDATDSIWQAVLFQKEGKTNNASGKSRHRPSINCTDTASAYSSMFSSPSNKNHFFIIWMELQPVYFYFNASLLSRHQKSNESVDSRINRKKWRWLTGILAILITKMLPFNITFQSLKSTGIKILPARASSLKDSE